MATLPDKGQRPPRKRLDAANRLWQRIVRENGKRRKEMDEHQHCIYEAHEPYTDSGEWGIGRAFEALDTRKRRPKGVPRWEGATFVRHSHKHGHEHHRHLTSQPHSRRQEKFISADRVSVPPRSHLQEPPASSEGLSG